MTTLVETKGTKANTNAERRSAQKPCKMISTETLLFGMHSHRLQRSPLLSNRVNYVRLENEGSRTRPSRSLASNLQIAFTLQSAGSTNYETLHCTRHVLGPHGSMKHSNWGDL